MSDSEEWARNRYSELMYETDPATIQECNELQKALNLRASARNHRDKIPGHVRSQMHGAAETIERCWMEMYSEDGMEMYSEDGVELYVGDRESIREGQVRKGGTPPKGPRPSAPPGQGEPEEDLDNLAQYIRDWRERKGFHTPADIDEGGDMMLGKLMLVVTEVSEAAEAVRHADEENFREEIADTLIRLLDICGTVGIDPWEAIMEKMYVNEDRPPLHGKETSI